MPEPEDPWVPPDAVTRGGCCALPALAALCTLVWAVWLVLR